MSLIRKTAREAGCTLIIRSDWIVWKYHCKVTNKFACYKQKMTSYKPQAGTVKFSVMWITLHLFALQSVCRIKVQCSSVV